MLRIFCAVLIFTFACFPSDVGANSANKRRKLYEQRIESLLRQNISTDVPPLTSQPDGLIPVYIYFQLHRVISLNSEDATLQVSGKIRLRWSDDRYKWKKTNDLPNALLMPPKTMWIPEVTLSTSTDFSLDDSGGILVRDDGYAIIEKTMKIEVACPVDVKYFPRDVQNCELAFMPALPQRRVIKTFKHAKMGEDHSSTIGEEWTLEKCDRTVEKRKTSDMYQNEAPVDGFIVSILLRRNSAFYFLTIIIPVLMLTIATKVPYFLPPNLIDDKASMPISAYLSFNVYMLLIEKSLPKDAKIPVLGQTMAVVMAMCILTELMQAISVKFYCCHLKRIPRPLFFLYFRIFAPMCFIRSCHGSPPSNLEPIWKAEESADSVPADKTKTVQKNWLTMGRINDRIGLMISSAMSLIAFIYLFGSCY